MQGATRHTDSTVTLVLASIPFLDVWKHIVIVGGGCRYTVNQVPKGSQWICLVAKQSKPLATKTRQRRPPVTKKGFTCLG